MTMTAAPSEAALLVRNGSRATGRGNPWKGRTHCEHGHEYTPENTYWRTERSGSGRRCRACTREDSRRWYAARGKALRAAQRAQRTERKTA
jgi:hypothetical protein